MSGASDWTERHRPTSEHQLEGNESQRRKIREWLDGWVKGQPKKKGILLVGPPGVGKTTVARAIAQDMGWTVIELNASDTRNAVAIRKAATQSSTHRSLFHDPSKTQQRTLILLREEDIDYTNDAIDVLVNGNHGDLRALVRDLQVLSSGGLEKLNPELVREHLEAGVRDMTTEVFPGMESLYRSKAANDAVTIGRSIDKQPSDLMNWVHWNNASLFDEVAMRRGSKALTLADRSVESRYRDLAHHSSYWTLHLSSLSASVANNAPLPTRIYPSYPNYLRRSGSWARPAIINHLADLSKTSKSTVRREFMPLLSALHQENPVFGDPNRFEVSLALGLSADEHVALCNLPVSRKSTKALIQAYEQAEEKWKDPVIESVLEELHDEELSPEPVVESDPEVKRDSAQRTLF